MTSMVSLCLSFFPPPWPVQNLIEEKLSLESSQNRVSNKIIFGPVEKINKISEKRRMSFVNGTQGFLVSYFSAEGISTMTPSCPYQPTKRLREVTVSASSLFAFSYCGDTTIAGYWVGPDVDDGWGFVKAFVNQIS